MKSLLHRTANLNKSLARLARSIDSGIKDKVEDSVSELWLDVTEVTPDLVKLKVWRNKSHAIQDVFIEPVEVTSFFKLNSLMSAFVHAVYLKDEVIKVSMLSHIKMSLEILCNQYGINHELIIK